MEIRFKIIEGKRYIFDAFRQKFVRATPEEVVRQHFCRFLVNERQFPIISIANECGMTLNGRQLRCDTLIAKHAVPIAIVEYKAPEVEITQQVFEQVARYNMVYGVPYFFISNGRQTYACRYDASTQRWSYLTDIPTWEAMQP